MTQRKPLLVALAIALCVSFSWQAWAQECNFDSQLSRPPFQNINSITVSAACTVPEQESSQPRVVPRSVSISSVADPVTVDLDFKRRVYDISGNVVYVSRLNFANAVLRWDEPLMLSFFKSERQELKTVTISTDCATLANLTASIAASASTSATYVAGDSYLFVQSYTAPSGAVKAQDVNVTCSLPSVTEASDGTPVVLAGSSLELLNALAFVDGFGSRFNCSTVQLYSNVSVNWPLWPQFTLRVMTNVTIRAAPGSDAVTVLDLAGGIGRIFVESRLTLVNLSLLNPEVLRGRLLAPGTNLGLLALPVWAVHFTPRFSFHSPKLYLTNVILWITDREFQYLNYWALVIATPITSISDQFAYLRAALNVELGPKSAQRSYWLNFMTMQGLGMSATNFTLATTTAATQVIGPPFPITVQGTYPPQFQLTPTTSSANVTYVPIYDQSDLVSALTTIERSPPVLPTALILWRNVTLDPATWPSSGFTVTMKPTLFLTGTLYGNLTVLDFSRVPRFLTVPGPLTCTAFRGFALWMHQLTFVNMPNALVSSSAVGGTQDAGLTLPAGQRVPVDLTLPLGMFWMSRVNVNIVFNGSTLVVPRGEWEELRLTAASQRSVKVYEPFSNAAWYCVSNRTVYNVTGATPDTLLFDLLWLYGFLAIDSRVTYAPPENVTLLYDQTYIPPPPEPDGDGGLRAWQIALIVVGCVVGAALAAGLLALFLIRRARALHRTSGASSGVAAGGGASKDDLRATTYSVKASNGSATSGGRRGGGGSGHGPGSGGSGTGTGSGTPDNNVQSMVDPEDSTTADHIMNGVIAATRGKMAAVGGGGSGSTRDVAVAAATGNSTTHASSSDGPSSDNAAKQPIDELNSMIQSLAHEIDDRHLVILDVLGQGGFGTVYKGMWKGLMVAVKTITFQDRMFGGEKAQHRAIMEAAISSSLSHPNVVITYSYDIKPLRVHSDADSGGFQIQAANNRVTDWKLYIIQEYCDAGSLRTAVLKRKFMDDRRHEPRLEMILDTSLELAGALCHLHDRNVVHGDMNPNNVLLKRDSSRKYGAICKIADFGLSVKMAAGQSHISNMRRGTPFYTAPEVMSKGNVTKAADVFSFGVMLWELYHSMVCYTAAAGNFAARDVFPRFPRKAPLDFADLATRCMAPEPTWRPTFREVEQGLADMLARLRHVGSLPTGEDTSGPDPSDAEHFAVPVY